ncbi:HAD-IIIA family hydrolase [Ornithinicoccus halotolerans]|uniref:HAD-IIIA family hydrolase n=1 Tax=Ornithinicoccus halotolerans TaxID=1748220 RepID=UPI0012960045|nr:HAD-IIIA family hydrolase [Ornithinicoccus halotolerans]
MSTGPGAAASAPSAPAYTIVVPTVGRPSLHRLLADLAGQQGGRPPAEVVLVDDRPLPGPSAGTPSALDVPELPCPVRVLRTGGRGPAAARNAGWRSAGTGWVAFLDDDVRLPDGWAAALATDLARAPVGVAGVQGRIEVPLPADRPATDWERNTAGLESARWATADMAYRREALATVHGFDERFPLAYREDADLALRVRDAGWRLERGGRHIVHPARPARWDVSIRVQRGAASDALMRALHGRHWRARGQTGRGRLPWHLATVASAAAGVVLLGAGRHRAAALAAAAWGGLTADFARRRIAPGPRPGHEGWLAEWARMATTSVVIPVAAVWHRARGELRYRDGVAPWPPPTRAVLFDRDGTLVHDVPYNGDPDRVEPVAGADEALRLLRDAGLRIGLVSNQSGIGRGLLDEQQVDAVNSRVEELLGRLDTLQYCPHHPEAGCPCRKPAPGLVLAAAEELGVRPHECVVVGDIGADVDAARAAGAWSVLVPTGVTRTEEVVAAELVAPDLVAAADVVLATAGGERR